MKPEQQRQIGLVVPNRESVVQQQVDTLLGVLGMLSNYLLMPNREFTGEGRPELDGGAHAAATATMVAVCGRLDQICADESRWGLGHQDQLHKSVIDMHNAQTAFLKTQTESAAAVQRPSYQLRPVIAAIQDGFIAYWGDITKAQGAIVGRGTTPRAALEDFDAAFERTPNEQLIVIAEDAATPAPELPETPEEQKTKARRNKKAE